MRRDAAPPSPRSRGRAGRGIAGAAALVTLVLLAELGGRWWMFGHDEVVAGAALPPGWPHLMGTTSIGQDVLALVLRGTRRTITVAGTAALGAAVLGTLVGAAAGYLRGWVDGLLMRVVDLVLTLPPLALLVVLASGLSAGSPLSVGLALSATLWAPLARVVRSLVLAAGEAGYVVAARGLGASPARVLARHVVPGVLPVVAAATTLTAAVAILAETGLAYLGLGVAPPDTSLGALIARGQDEMLTTPWVFCSSGGMVVVVVLLLSLLGDAVDDAGRRGRTALPRRPAPVRARQVPARS